MMEPRLRFKLGDIGRIADRYEYPNSEIDLMELKPKVLHRGYMTKPELQMLAYWKAPRSARHAQKNPEDFIAEITYFAFKATSERARVESLTLLDGVSWPTATVILHLFHNDPYPILDFRALWSVTLEVPSQYTFGFWWAYVKFCRDLAQTEKVTMRTLDRALWQYSKENQQTV